MVAILKRTPVRCRCNRSACQDRATLPKHPDEYVNPPRCRRCHKGIYRVDGYRNSGREHHGPVCDPKKTGCDGYSFPHHHGRGWCKFNPAVTVEQLRERHERGTWA